MSQDTAQLLASGGPPSRDSPKPFQPTEEQVALAEARRLKKLQQQQRAKEEEEARGRILPREWLSIQDPPSESVTVKVMTWNLLAQSLVRRELFPTSDCLKASQREHMLYREILSHQAHICCLQVDRTEKLFPVLQKAGYDYVYAAGPFKKHGCLIAYRKEFYELYGDKNIVYDQQEVRPEDGVSNIHGSSFKTKNIGSFVALKRLDEEDDGLIVATTHLFWHPSYTYERARQTAILLREAAKDRKELGKDHWPCIIAGDFNFAPDDPAYSLLVGDPLLPDQITRLASSRVVHVTIDPDVPIMTTKMLAEDEEGTTETDPDRMITNARAAVEADGLLADAELEKITQEAGYVVSAYDRGLRLSEGIKEQGLTYGSRIGIPADRKGAYEPVWTSYTHYWKTVLDYIFILEPSQRPVTIVGLAKPIPTDKLDPGLPQKGVCGSDHISLCAELAWPKYQTPNTSS
ncbi:Endonuclease/exonuclease/phosphatase [Panus rudis PR-1116 ss-1]|nr:Endonuclease/exonuclease/phosphatase [Panus rudis PR-1116 ss-1]